MPKMEIFTTPYKRCTLIKTSGRVDGSNAPELARAFKELTDVGTFNLVFDMSEVNFMASAGWWVLIDVQKTCKRNRGELALACVQTGISDSLKLVGMDSYFSTFIDVTGAVGNF
jgi:anti-anti-sigma factor